VFREYSEFTSGRFASIRNIVKLMQTLLPRELRDMIYAALYKQDEAVTLFARDYLPHESCEAEQMHQEPNRRIHGWPEDTAGFLNRDIVGSKTSQEAAKIFYSSNTFVIRGTSYLYELREFDHYRSGAIPIYSMQNLILHVDGPSQINPFSNAYYQYSLRNIPDNATYVDIQSEDKLRHEMEILSGLVDGHHRSPGTIEIYAYRQYHGPWDLRGSVHHLVTLKEQGLAVNLKIQRSFKPLEPYPNLVTSASELDWLDISSYLDNPTEEERQLLLKPHRGWEVTPWDDLEQNGDMPSETIEGAFRGHTFDLPCDGPRVCPRRGHGDCSDHSWHAGWYRALLHDLAERTLEKELVDSEFESCRFCPDERLVEALETKTMVIRLPRPGPNG
jgi:hypothetical protein